MTNWRRAFSISKKEVATATPPELLSLIEECSENHGCEDNGPNISTSGRTEIVLVPKPSADLADPLNIPQWRKIMALAFCSVYSAVANWISVSISPAFPVLAVPGAFGSEHVSYTQLGRLVSVNLLMLGVSGIWWTPLSNVFGRRCIILVALLTLTLSSMWGALARADYWNLFAARFFMGIGGGAADTVCPQLIGELFFVHEAGRAMVFYVAGLTLGASFGSLSGGYILSDRDVAWIHWVNLIISASALVLGFFFLPETLYERHYDTAPVTNRDEENTSVKNETTYIDFQETTPVIENSSHGYWQSLKIGIYRGGIVKQITRLAPPFLLPGVWVAALWQAGLVGSVVAAQIVAPTLVASPPYLWGHNVGLINIGSIIGAFLALSYTYFSSDRVLKLAAQRNKKGFAEPESRLWSALPGLILATGGLIMFGFCGNQPGGSMWVGLEVGTGLLAFAVVLVPSVGFNYIFESYGVLASDCFVVVVVVRGVISFAMTFFISEWVVDKGSAEPFGILGMLVGISVILTVLLILYGKRTRIATANIVTNLD